MTLKCCEIFQKAFRYTGEASNNEYLIQQNILLMEFSAYHPNYYIISGGYKLYWQCMDTAIFMIFKKIKQSSLQVGMD